MKLRTLLWTCCGLLLTLTACEDPSNVGLGLIGEQGGNAEVEVVTPSTFESTPAEDLTGNTVRVLAGTVNDPLLATISATGYLDIGSRSTTISDPITEASLRLVPDYLYGDTTAIFTLTLREMPEEWEATGRNADTTLVAGAELAQVTFAASDTLVVVDLPQAWVEANDAFLRDTTFFAEVHGFQLDVSGGNAVVGFDSGTSRFRTIAADTVDFRFGKTLTSLARTGTPAVPPNRVLLQDGVGPAVALNFDFDAALPDGAVNRAILRAFADTLALGQDAPPNFVRPSIERLQLIGIDEDGEEFLLYRASFVAEKVEFDSARLGIGSADNFSVDRILLGQMIQEAILGNPRFARLRLEVPAGLNSISALFLYDQQSGETAPAAVLTLTPF